MVSLPQANWQWSVDTEDNSVKVLMGEHSVDIVYQARMFIPFPQKTLYFSLDDVANYSLLSEQFSVDEYSDEQICHIILHILAVTLFHKPIMPKSWLFQTQSQEASYIESRECVYLTSAESNVRAKYFVIDCDEHFALCLLVDVTHPITSRKTFRQGQIVKVSLDKITCIESLYRLCF